ncbi:MAG: thermonuclease family protein [Limnospira sp. PMC 1291.21]|uniref:Nuclease n=3 Tax=Limnospira TaxID=2596745 RepID=A0A9P1KE91_9CYAN|nr:MULTISPECIES: thermonuclease family protein [Limnospira]EKD05845.1 SNase domain protein [Arthrospira platensis C1]MDC0836619.1 thermonuclease family protein [Limnoraphis robusta]MDY7052645.1 thermonuclease family protein [Limnospira fusiformis LS22]QJB27126.1 thermonuclease family protein [Limnospira fusiformis SAG 85.79]EDZ92507.1 nuclease (SNase domain protein) [Limnospira maxima CS-328]
MGTRINNLQVTKVVDGDTIKVLLNGRREPLRLHCVDTEESFAKGSKPVTQTGIEASAMAKKYFTEADGTLTQVDLEFDSHDSLKVCLDKYRDTYGRLICYVHKGDDNYNLRLIQEGWSPYYIKYGRSQFYHRQMMEAEAIAQSHNLIIWNRNLPQNKPFRDYELLSCWWSLRDSIIQDYRHHGKTAGVLSVRFDYPEILAAAASQQWITVFCDLQDGITKWIGNSALIHTGSKDHIIKLWIPEAKSDKNAPIVRLINRRYAGLGRGYVYITGRVIMYRDKPEITINHPQQLSDFCPTPHHLQQLIALGEPDHVQSKIIVESRS